MNETLPHYTVSQVAEILHRLGSIRVNRREIFSVQIINAHNDQVIGLDRIKQSGMVYLKINHSGHVANLPMWIEVD